MKSLKNKLNKEKGAAMILAIFVMIIVMTTVALVSTQVNNQIIGNRNTRDQVTMRYSAEAGVEKTIADVCSQLEKELDNLSYEPPGDPGGGIEDNATYKYLVRARDNLKIAAIEYNPGNNDNNDIWPLHNRVNSILSRTTPENKLNSNDNKTYLKNEINYVIEQINNIRNHPSYNDRRTNSVDNYLETSIHYLKLDLYTINRIGTCSANLTGDYVALLVSENVNNIINGPINQSVSDLGKAIDSLELIRQQGIIDYNQKVQLEAQIRVYEQSVRGIEIKIRNDVEQKLRNLENALKNNPAQVEKSLDETILGIEGTILEANKGSLSLQLELHRFEDDTFIAKRLDKIPSIEIFENNIKNSINDLENVEIRLIELKCKLNKPNRPGEANQTSNPNLPPSSPSKIEIDIQEATMDLGDNNKYKRDGFIIEVPIEWQSDGNGDYKLKDIPPISQDVLSEGFIGQDLTKKYKIDANVTFYVERGTDGKYNVTYTVNSWDKI